MGDIEATKFYVRHRGRYPESTAQDYARRGFWSFGCEVETFESVEDIDRITDLGPTVGVAGYIGDVLRALRKIGRPAPPSVDYPPELREFLGRSIREGTLGEARAMAEPVFVKPVQHKLFTGLVFCSTDADARRSVVTLPDEVPVFLSEPVKFVAEYRCFVLDFEILDCRRYVGDFGVAPDRAVIEAAVRALVGRAPRAFSLDWGVSDGGKTLLVEMNEGYALGHYGLAPTLYARMLSARWHELAGG
jgi:ATP-grasp domain, R2K clade family 3